VPPDREQFSAYDAGTRALARRHGFLDEWRVMVVEIVLKAQAPVKRSPFANNALGERNPALGHFANPRKPSLGTIIDALARESLPRDQMASETPAGGASKSPSKSARRLAGDGFAGGSCFAKPY
jgi:hypothetical protein